MAQFCLLFGNTCLSLLLDITLQVCLLAAGIVIALWYESKADPNLTITLAPTRHAEFGDQRGTVRFTHAYATNAGPSRLPLIGRRTAISTYGTVEVFTLDDKPLHSRPMPIRWSGQPEPTRLEVVNNHLTTLLEPSLFPASQNLDIPPSATRKMDVAMRKANDENAYGWSHENYQYPGWEHPEFAIPSGEYKVKITLHTGDKTFATMFRLSNPKNFTEFDLAPLDT